MSHSAPRSIWTVSTVFFLVLSLVGTGVYIYGTNRYQQEQSVSESLRMEVATLRVTLAKMEKSVAHLDQLPPMAQAEWEKVVTDQINSAAIGAGVRIMDLSYSSRDDEKERGLGQVAFSLEVQGGSAAQARCLALLEERVVGMRFNDMEGMLGVGDSYYLSLLSQGSSYDSSYESLRISGIVYRETGGPK